MLNEADSIPPWLFQEQELGNRPLPDWNILKKQTPIVNNHYTFDVAGLFTGQTLIFLPCDFTLCFVSTTFFVDYPN